MDRIASLKARRAGVIEGMEAILAAADAEAGLTAEQAAAFDALKAKDDALASELARAEEVERRKAAAATPVATIPAASTVPASPRAADEKGLRFARVVRALAAGGGIPHVAAQIAEKEWGDSGLFANQNMGSGAAGGFLVPEEVSGEVIELLRAQSVVMSLNPIVVPMTRGNMTMNRLNTGTNAAYIGEQQNAPATGVTFGQVKLEAKKLAALVPISNDLLRANSVAADRIVRDDLVTSLGVRMDLAFIRGAGTVFTPKGFRFQHIGYATEATHVLAATATVNLANVTTDLGRLELALLNADVPMTRPGWIMAPRTMMYLMNVRDGNGNFAFPEIQTGTLRGKPFRVTTQIPTNLGGGANESELYLADFAHVLVGEHQAIDIALSTEAAYVDANAQMQAAFSRDETVIRAIAQHDFGMRHLPAVAVLTAVTWGV